MKEIKINFDYLREPDFDEKYYTQFVCMDGSYQILDVWMDEYVEIIKINDNSFKVVKVDLVSKDRNWSE